METKNFKMYEFECNCGCKVNKTQPILLEKLQKVRDSYKKPMKINSGYRCPEYNAKVGGSETSYHMNGLAADIEVFEGSDKFDLVNFAIQHGFKGIAVYEDFVHLDLRPEGTMW